MTNPIDVLIGSRVREIRESKNVPLNVLSSKTGINVAQLARYESGFDRYSPAHLLEIAKCLKLNVSHLFSDPWIAEDNHTPVLSITSPEEQEFNESNSFAELEIRLEVARADVESIGKRIALLRQDIAAAQGDPWADALRERLRDLMLAICDIAFAADEQASAEQVNDN